MWRPPADVLGHRVGDAEVDEDRTEAGKVLGNKDVGRLDVTMHDAALMGVVQRVGDLRQRREPLATVGRPATGPPSTSSMASQPGPHSYIVTTWGWSS